MEPTPTQQAIADALSAFGQNQPPTSFVPGDASADAFVRDIGGNPLAFLLAVIADYRMKAERAWALPYYLHQRMGLFGPSEIAQAGAGTVAQHLADTPALHRHPQMVGGWIADACARVQEDYAGDAGAIWGGMPSAVTLLWRLQAFKGVSQKKASMAVNILFRDLGVPIAEPQNIDVSYDIQVRRVFLRAGLVDRDTMADVILAARGLRPDYHGGLDVGAWLIGREWCSPTQPRCADCEVGSLCAKRDLPTVTT